MQGQAKVQMAIKAKKKRHNKVKRRNVKQQALKIKNNILKQQGRLGKIEKNIIQDFSMPWRHFNILPKHSMNPIIFTELLTFPTKLCDRLAYLEKNYPLTRVSHVKYNCGWSREKSILIRKTIQKILKARAIFRKFLHIIRSKHLKPANTTDAITMEIPRVPIRIVEWSRRQYHVFEASSLMKDITCRLLNSDGVFEDPQLPRNLFTNLPFTQSQTISIWNSLASSNVAASAAFTLFRNARFNLEKFILENSAMLKLNALRKTMAQPTSYDYKDRMLDFIAFAYTQSHSFKIRKGS
jgi:hypothetical protein